MRTLQESCSITQNTILNALDGLTEKDLIKVSDRGSVTQANEYRVIIPRASKTEAQGASKIDARRAVKTDATKQSIKKNNTTTYVIDCKPLISIGLTETHLKRIFEKGHLSQEQIQNSIEAFAFDLRKSQKVKSIKSSPISYFLGILLKGPYLPSAEFKKQAGSQVADEKMIGPSAEEIKSTQGLERRREILKKIVDREFQKWQSRLEQGQLQKIVLPIAQRSPHLTDIVLREHFEKTVLKISVSSLDEEGLKNLFADITKIMV